MYSDWSYSPRFVLFVPIWHPPGGWRQDSSDVTPSPHQLIVATCKWVTSWKIHWKALSDWAKNWLNRSLRTQIGWWVLLTLRPKTYRHSEPKAQFFLAILGLFGHILILPRYRVIRLGSNWVILVPIVTNPGLFNIRFQ